MPKGELVTSDIRRKLSRLKGALRGRLLGEGLGWVVVALVALVFVTLAFDYTLRLDLPLRIAIMLCALAAVGFVAWQRLLSPLLVPMTAQNLALLVERRFGQLDDRLISALQFADGDDLEGYGMSRQMIHKVADEANRLASPLNFASVINARGLLHSLGGATGAIAVLAVFAVFQLPTLERWFERNVLLADIDWPQDTYLRVVAVDANQMDADGDFTVLRGEDLSIVVIADGEVQPPSISLHADYPSFGQTVE